MRTQTAKYTAKVIREAFKTVYTEPDAKIAEFMEMLEEYTMSAEIALDEGKLPGDAVTLRARLGWASDIADYMIE